MWGSNAEGQLGLDRLKDADEPTLLEFDEKIVHVACGYYHTLMVTGIQGNPNVGISMIPLGK